MKTMTPIRINPVKQTPYNIVFICEVVDDNDDDESLPSDNTD
ncbi:unnamed protein product [Brugia timori]|uniref:Uncharacterized protein n=1 Tax=Brugia timori TaxID=42155 RepID=A0A0R3RCY4_9BILA|nr:unnamed protein product [Brugia timori]